jgi:hypothetical protein
VIDLEKKIKQFRNIVRLANGELKPKTDAQRVFVAVADGRIKPKTDWEVIYINWKKQAEPDIDEFFLSGRASNIIVEAALSKFGTTKKTKTKKRHSTKRSMSVAEAKKLGRPKRSQEEIDKTHRKSGFYNKKVKIVQGGKVSPR